jgi:monoamine oxidase
MRGTRVLVAGAGLAGLAAAHELAAAGTAVTVIDARERVGGRVWTTRDGFAAGQHAELGGEFIDANHRSMRQLVDRFDLTLVPVLARGFAHRYEKSEGTIDVSRSRPWEALRDALAPLIRRYTAAHGNPEAEPIRELATYSLRGWLCRQEVPPDVHAMARLIRGFFLADPEDLSVLPVVQQLAEGGSPSRTKMFRIAGGNDQLLKALVAATPARLLLRHHVREIHQAADRVIAHVTDAAGHAQQIEADAAVVALPASTLRDVRVTPPLPDDQQRAIEALPYGQATKVAVQCDGTGLSTRRAKAFATDTALGAFWDATEGQPSRRHAMLNFLAGGTASRALRDRVATTGASGLLADLCWLGLGGEPATAACGVTWEDDPLARGGYAFLDPGYDPSWRPLLARRAGRVVFAGEHTSEDFQGYMEGAVQSGERAAAELTRRGA